MATADISEKKSYYVICCICARNGDLRYYGESEGEQFITNMLTDDTFKTTKARVVIDKLREATKWAKSIEDMQYVIKDCKMFIYELTTVVEPITILQKHLKDK